MTFKNKQFTVCPTAEALSNTYNLYGSLAAVLPQETLGITMKSLGCSCCALTVSVLQRLCLIEEGPELETLLKGQSDKDNPCPYTLLGQPSMSQNGEWLSCWQTRTILVLNDETEETILLSPSPLVEYVTTGFLNQTLSLEKI